MWLAIIVGSIVAAYAGLGTYLWMRKKPEPSPCPRCQEMSNNEFMPCAGSELYAELNRRTNGTKYCDCCDACRQKCCDKAWHDHHFENVQV